MNDYMVSSSGGNNQLDDVFGSFSVSEGEEESESSDSDSESDSTKLYDSSIKTLNLSSVNGKGSSNQSSFIRL